MKPIRVLCWLISAFILVLGTTAIKAQELAVGKPLPVEAGLMFDYEDGGFVNLRIEENQWKVIFLNKEKLVIDPAWTTAAIRWDLKGNTNDKSKSGFIKGAGPFLVSSRNVNPPYSFWVYFSFVNADGSIKKAFPRSLMLPGKVK
ncbi:MAG: hypothetical protein SFY80_00330 [Verrucomicrobiota bacterium]|nr:hypothetical protein [Verrucomicrobiota bacterium]